MFCHHVSAKILKPAVGRFYTKVLTDMHMSTTSSEAKFTQLTRLFVDQGFLYGLFGL